VQITISITSVAFLISVPGAGTAFHNQDVPGIVSVVQDNDGQQNHGTFPSTFTPVTHHHVFLMSCSTGGTADLATTSSCQMSPARRYSDRKPICEKQYSVDIEEKGRSMWVLQQLMFLFEAGENLY
jgi:hypothetical protein